MSTTAGSVVRSVSSTSDTRSSFHEHGDEPSIDHAALMDVLVHAGYTGLITSEWEGHAYIDHFSGWDMRHGQQDLLARLLRSAQPTVSAMSTRPIPTLIVTGHTDIHHDWRATTAALRALLEQIGRLEVRVTEEFRGARAATLEPYELVVHNYYRLRAVG